MSDNKKFSSGDEPLLVTDKIDTKYDFVPSFAVADETTNYDLRAQQSTAFSNVNKAWLIIIWTTQDITIRLNSTDKPPITIPADESPYELRNIIAVSEIYITNASGSSTNIKVMLV